MKKLLASIILASSLGMATAYAGNYSQDTCNPNSESDSDDVIYGCVTDAYDGDCWCDVNGACAATLKPAGSVCGNSSYICGTQQTPADVYGGSKCTMTAQDYNYGA